MFVIVGRLTQAVHVVDGEESVFVDGVAVIAVTDDEGVDTVEFGYQHFKDAERMHGAKGMGSVGAEQHFAKGVPKIRALGDVDGEGGQGVGDAVFGGLRKRVAVSGHHGKDAKDGGGVAELGSGKDVDAAVAEVEKTAGGGEEIEGGFGVAAGALEDATTLAGPLLCLLQVKEESEPDGEVVVAEAAGTVFQIGLEMEDGVAELGVAGAGDLTELLSDGVPLAEDEAREDGLMELLVERELAGKKAAIEGGEREFEIVGIETAGFFDGAGTGAGAKADVPHALNDGSDSLLGLLF